MRNNTTIGVNIQEVSILQGSANRFKLIFDKWFEDRKAEENKELNEYDEIVDT